MLRRNHYMLQHVSRETFDSLLNYTEQLLLWNSRINLISKSTINEIEQRHIIDSLQLQEYILPSDKHIVDFGSGGGLPAMVLAITNREKRFSLCEVDKRKCEFLRHCKIMFQLDNVAIYNKRIEWLEPLSADLVISRACAALTKLLNYMDIHAGKNSRGLFLKGKSIIDEITFASSFRFDYTLHPSKTSPDGVIIEIANLERIA